MKPEMAMNDQPALVKRHYLSVLLTCNSGFVYKYDVSLAASDFENFIRDTQALLEDLDQSLLCVNWGHIIGKLYRGNEELILLSS